MVISGTTGIDFGNTPILNASSAQVQGRQVTPYSGFKNYIINGNFDIWQRGTSQTTNGYGSADRWYNTLVNTTILKTTGIPGYSNSVIGLQATGVTNACLLSQAFESSVTSILKTKKVTLSFSFNSNSNQPADSLAFSIQCNATADSMLTGTWTTIAISTKTPLTIVQKATLTVDIPADSSANGIRVNIQTNNIINNSYVYIYNVQLEEGSIATPFENRPYGLELSLCQRYFQKFRIKGRAAGGYCSFGRTLQTTMRTAPSLSNRYFYTNETTSITDYSVYSTDTEITLNWSVTGAAISFIDVSHDLSAEL